MPIEGKNIIKEFGKPATRVLHGLNFKIEDGEFLAITGKSGSGKSTLLYLISTLDYPTTGDLWMDGQITKEIGVKELHAFRNKNVGFIFQFHYLLPELTSLENVLLPARNLKLHKEKKQLALQFLEEFGIADKAHRFPSQMSGGEQQRVAIARALVLHPRYIFADEPTGNLDSVNGLKVMEILKRENKDHGTTIVLVTHDPDYAAMAKKEIYLVDGQIYPTTAH